MRYQIIIMKNPNSTLLIHIPAHIKSDSLYYFMYKTKLFFSCNLPAKVLLKWMFEMNSLAHKMVVLEVNTAVLFSVFARNLYIHTRYA